MSKQIQTANKPNSIHYMQRMKFQLRLPNGGLRVNKFKPHHFSIASVRINSIKQKTTKLESKFQQQTNTNRIETAFLQAEYEILIPHPTRGVWGQKIWTQSSFNSCSQNQLNKAKTTILESKSKQQTNPKRLESAFLHAKYEISIPQREVLRGQRIWIPSFSNSFSQNKLDKA